jgi:Fe-coproporphyrin III synthase
VSDPYSPDKIQHHHRHVNLLRDAVSVSPIHVQLIPTNVCNQGCKFCAYRQDGYSSNESFDPRQSIPFHKLAEIVSDCDAIGVRAIQLTGGGEPVCHPQFYDLCELILSCGIDLAVVTNGSRWTEEHVNCLSGAKWVRFSVDAGNAKTYSMIRRTEGKIYDRVRKIIRLMTGRASHPTVGVGFVVNLDNWREIVQATLAARDDGADNIRLSAVFQDGGAGYFDGFADEASELCREAEELSTDTFKVINLFGDRVGDLAQGIPDYSHCWYSHICTYIGADLAVYRCCVYAYNHKGLLGSIFDRPFREMWADLVTQNGLWEFDPRSCERCMYNERNRSIQSVINGDRPISSDPPDHVNFV